MKHRWMLKSRDFHTQRFECVCGWIKTVTSAGDSFPQTVYTKGASRYDRAPAHVTLANNLTEAYK